MPKVQHYKNEAADQLRQKDLEILEEILQQEDIPASVKVQCVQAREKIIESMHRVNQDTETKEDRQAQQMAKINAILSRRNT